MNDCYEGVYVVTDEQIIELYWKRDEKAIKETNAVYESYCYSIANNILHNYEDSEECVNDTWMKAWNTIPPQRPNYLRIFLAKITRNLSLDKYRAKTANKRGGSELSIILDELEESIPSSTNVEHDVLEKELIQTINCFLHSLPSRNCDLFLRRYFFAEEIGSIARRYGMRESNVFVILSRTRKGLKDYLAKEGLL